MKSAKDLPSCPLCSQPVQNNGRHSYRGLSYHKSCFKCNVCGKSLMSEGKEWENGVPFCNPCAKREQLRRLHLMTSSGAVSQVGETAREAGHKRAAEDHGDVEGVNDAIGDEIEASMQSMVPRCATCGGTFLPTDAIYMCGIQKFHTECRGRNLSEVTAKRHVSPKEALRSVEDLLTIKLLLPNNNVLTFFFIKTMSKHIKVKKNTVDRNAVVVKFVPDDSEHARTVRHVHGNCVSPCEVMVAGDNFYFPDTATTNKDGELVATVVGTKMQLYHHVRIKFYHSSAQSTISAELAELTICEPA